MSISWIAWRASSAEIFSLPRVILIAISVRETELNSRTFSGFPKVAAARLLRRSGDSIEKINTAVSKSTRKSLASPKEILDFLVGHRLPPIRIEDLNLPPQSAKHRFFLGWFLRAHDIYHGHTAAADGHRLSVFDGLNQFRQFIFGVGYADLHAL